MIAIHKYSNILYPVTHLFFPQTPEEVGKIHRWSVVQIVQASPAVAQYFHDYAVCYNAYDTLVSDLHQPLDTLWKRIHHSRQCKIQQARDISFEIKVNELPLPELYQFILEFHIEKGLYRPRCNNFKQFCSHCDVFSLHVDDELVIVHVLMRDLPSRVMAYYSCYNFASHVSNANRGSLNSYLHWWEMQYYKERDVHLYDWGGVTTDQQSSAYGVTQFKKKFGGDMIREWNMILLGSMLQPIWPMANRIFRVSGKQQSLGWKQTAMQIKGGPLQTDGYITEPVTGKEGVLQ
ncbi:MAG TPA: peptidoglycan bridge formation glycyltransferase FemA/FemB family protein [Armatimonadota bacterium]|nr:peptidoglycan bridge formation glycyltransferase FemA/FemB family protein [Armatimonadota bacterium]